MSYAVHLFRVETKNKHLASDLDDFFEDNDNLELFTAVQGRELAERLTQYDYILHREDHFGKHFSHVEYGSALLTDRGLYFSTSFDDECIFEVGMNASEFTDTDEYAKYDPQNGVWEEL